MDNNNKKHPIGCFLITKKVKRIWTITIRNPLQGFLNNKKVKKNMDKYNKKPPTGVS